MHCPGYAPLSTSEQDPALQHDALREAAASWVGLGRGIRITPDPFPQAARRTGRATLAASGSPCANAEGQPLAVVSLGVHGVAMFAPR